MTRTIGPREQALRAQREAQIFAQKPQPSIRAQKAADAMSAAARVKPQGKPKKRKAKRRGKLAKRLNPT